MDVLELCFFLTASVSLLLLFLFLIAAVLKRTMLSSPILIDQCDVMRI